MGHDYRKESNNLTHVDQNSIMLIPTGSGINTSPVRGEWIVRYISPTGHVDLASIVMHPQSSTAEKELLEHWVMGTKCEWIDA